MIAVFADQEAKQRPEMAESVVVSQLAPERFVEIRRVGWRALAGHTETVVQQDFAKGLVRENRRLVVLYVRDARNNILSASAVRAGLLHSLCFAVGLLHAACAVVFGATHWD